MCQIFISKFIATYFYEFDNFEWEPNMLTTLPIHSRLL